MSIRTGHVAVSAALLLLLGSCHASRPKADAAQVYEDFYVPALFGEWASRVADAADISEGDAVLDVACGTGVVAREAATRVGDGGSVTGLDIDEGMLAVARRTAPHIRWRHGDAQDLPFGDDSFDVVTCQFGLMFFPDREKAIREMVRVTRPGGRVVIAVWGPLDASPGYATLTRLLAEHMGPASADALRTPFNLGAQDQLAGLFERSGDFETHLETRVGSSRFPSIQTWVETEVHGWVALSQDVDERKVTALVQAAEQDLAGYVEPSGEVVIPIVAHIATIEVGSGTGR